MKKEYGWQELKEMGYNPKEICIIGSLFKTGRTVKPVRCSSRQIYKDEGNQEWVIIRGKYWRFPQGIDY